MPLSLTEKAKLYLAKKKLKKELKNTPNEYLLLTIQVIEEIIIERERKERKEKNASKK